MTGVRSLCVLRVRVGFEVSGSPDYLLPLRPCSFTPCSFSTTDGGVLGGPSTSPLFAQVVPSAVTSDSRSRPTPPPSSKETPGVLNPV